MEYRSKGGVYGPSRSKNLEFFRILGTVCEKDAHLESYDTILGERVYCSRCHHPTEWIRLDDGTWKMGVAQKCDECDNPAIQFAGRSGKGRSVRIVRCKRHAVSDKAINDMLFNFFRE